MLTVESIDVAYGRAQVLFGLSLTVAPGSLTCVMGRNGVGKTTLLKAVMGVLPVRSGRVEFDGHDITRLKTYERVRLGLGYAPQGHDTFPQLTVWENLQVVLEASPKATKESVDEALDVFPALRGLLRNKAGFLSGGQQQQLSMARTLVTRPSMLLLDEPTEGIQPSVILEIEEAIERLHRETGVAVLLVEQYLDLALRLADNFVIMDAGEVVRSGGREDLQDPSVRQLLTV
ncbi:urea ABC transporter ATP-binding subunit UrtE [Dactylosporangium fulvum]|uniref:Urea ABC transporter ATP-binding subunit UrtE n=1 Tax=Dactylosporangium fulvum TaxID=53359 RepID=A0ABY5VY75_9ACTN|nr:urea ABC transporter ATP-binding subunit UrtE [Dactylosporangium fulvum]UWP82119.1 urea ABC transporter ATP-binding subunit UrtE [Dactylosporangium fulvum]